MLNRNIAVLMLDKDCVSLFLAFSEIKLLTWFLF